MTNATTPATDRPDLEERCTVMYDRHASTPWAELYRAASDTVSGRVYEVKYYPEARAWTCQCQGFTAHHHCRHQRRADRLRRVRFFSVLFAPLPPRALRDELARREGRIADGTADADDFAAADFCTLRLGNLEAT